MKTNIIRLVKKYNKYSLREVYYKIMLYNTHITSDYKTLKRKFKDANTKLEHCAKYRNFSYQY